MAKFRKTIISHHNHNVVYLSRIDGFLPPMPVANATNSASTNVASILVGSPRSTSLNGGSYLRVCEDTIVGANMTSSALGERVAAALC
jgi:hypothetical protein